MPNEKTLLERYLAAEEDAERLFRQLEAEAVALAPAIERLRRWGELRYAEAAKHSQALLTGALLGEGLVEALAALGIDPRAQPPSVIGAQVRKICQVS